MTLPRVLAPLLLALAFAAPVVAAAQPGPAGSTSSLDAETNAYFQAVAKADAATLIAIASPTYHVITPDHKRLSYDDYFQRISSIAFQALPPMGMNVNIKGTTLTPTGATQTVDTLQWYFGGFGYNVRNVTRDSASHQLTWRKTASGKWLLDEDHIVSEYVN